MSNSTISAVVALAATLALAGCDGPGSPEQIIRNGSSVVRMCRGGRLMRSPKYGLWIRTDHGSDLFLIDQGATPESLCP